MFLFFVRRNNDIDHIVPVVYALKDRQGAQAAVLCQEPLYDLGSDFRLAFLRERTGTPVEYLYRFHMPTLRHRLVAPLLCPYASGPTRAASRRPPGRLAAAVSAGRRRMAQALLERALRSSFYDHQWAGDLLERTGARALVFDHNPPTRYVSASLIAAARARAIPIVAVPHGTHMLVNELRARTREEAGRIGRVQIFHPYDYILTMEPLHHGFLARMGVPEQKLVLLGSARYCVEWREVLARIAPPRVEPPVRPDGRLKLVYMDKQARDGVHQEIIDREIERISHRPDVLLVIKPETRTNIASSLKLARTAVMADTISSADLIDWADAVMVSHSSIAIEVLLRNKPLLHARYFHDNLTMFDEMGACSVFRSPAELDDALDRLAQDRTVRPYSQEAVSRFLTQVVDGGRPGRDVLGGYAAFLTAVARGGRTAPERSGLEVAT